MLSEKGLSLTNRYTKEIRRYTSERKEIKKKPSKSYGIDETGQQYLSYTIKRLDKISDFNHQIIREKVSENGTISNKIFGILKKDCSQEF